MTNKYRKTISLLLISMMFLLPACRRTEINHLIEPQEQAQEYVDVANRKNQRPAWVVNSAIFAFLGLLTVCIIHDLYYEDGHWLPRLIPNRELREENGVPISEGKRTQRQGESSRK